jgi:hypothetical protein
MPDLVTPMKPIYDPPHRAEQADERRDRGDGGKHAGAARNAAADRHFDAFKLQRDALFQTVGAQVRR